MTIEKAIILSAGQGSRLLPLTRDIPKCLIDLNGRTLIGWQVAALAANGIKDIVVVTGFRTERGAHPHTVQSVLSGRRQSRYLLDRARGDGPRFHHSQR